ncbi:MAG: DNA primase [Acetobacteraceae bacterium]|nr:DNA primase [Acetobacteraceae bacterium]
MALPPDFLDELRARTPLPGLIGRRTRLLRSGRNWKACCPFHSEKSPSFHVYDDHYHCFGCGAHGDAITFVMQTEGASFLEAVERLAAEAGLEVPKPSAREAERERERRDLHGVLAAAAEAFARRLFAPEGAEARAYLRRRGVSEESIARFGLGWSGDGRGGLVAELARQGIAPEQMEQAGLLRRREDGSLAEAFFNRVMFPIRDRRGRVIGFGGRTLGDAQPKYVNSPETPLFAKRRSLYGLDLAREAAFRGARVVVVEGYLDVIALDQAGRGGTPAFAPVAPLGTALTEEQLEEIWRLSPEPVLCFDGDVAGARAAARAAELALPRLAPERSLRLAALPAGEDPDTLVAKGGAAAFAEHLAKARPLHEALYDLLAEGRSLARPEDRAALRRSLEQAAARIADRALSAEYRRALLDRFFRETRPGAVRRAAPRPPPPPIRPEAARNDRARCLLALAMAHPWLLAQGGDEVLAGLDLPDGPAADLRSALLAWLGQADRLDSAALADHLHALGRADLLGWAQRFAGLPAAARPGADAQPAEAVDAWWHFAGLLRGEATLLADLEAARERWLATGRAEDGERFQRLARLREALRRGEGESA